jgi:hypothetical protein
LLQHFHKKFTEEEKVKMWVEWYEAKRKHMWRMCIRNRTIDVLKMIVSLDAFSEFPTLRKLALFALIIPATTAWVERGFSIMKIIKTERRSRLGEDTLSALMMIKINRKGERMTAEQRDRAMRHWLQAKARRGVGKYERLQRLRVETEAWEADEEETMEGEAAHSKQTEGEVVEGDAVKGEAAKGNIEKEEEDEGDREKKDEEEEEMELGDETDSEVSEHYSSDEGEKE